MMKVLAYSLQLVVLRGAGNDSGDCMSFFQARTHPDSISRKAVFRSADVRLAWRLHEQEINGKVSAHAKPQGHLR